MALAKRDIDNYGWCDNPVHSGIDHHRNENCTNFFSERDLGNEARAHDRKAVEAGMPGDGGVSARYVAEYRPY